MKVQEIKAWRAEDGRVFTEKEEAETHNVKISELVKLINTEIGGNWYLENIISKFILGNQGTLLNILKSLAEGTEYVTYSNEIIDDGFIGGLKKCIKDIDDSENKLTIELSDCIEGMEDYPIEEVQNKAEEALNNINELNKIGMQKFGELPIPKIGIPIPRRADTSQGTDIFTAENVCACKCKRGQLKEF